jgi:hypothetical protein
LSINYGTNPSPLSAISALIRSGYNNGLWNGTGIDSSSAAASSGSAAIGYADGTLDVAGAAAPNTVLLRYTKTGDSNLDGTVNLTDLLNLLNSYGQTGKDWSQGDVNYDGTVNLTDLLELLNTYGQVANTSLNASVIAPQAATAPAMTAPAEPAVTVSSPGLPGGSGNDPVVAEPMTAMQISSASMDLSSGNGADSILYS